MYTYRQTLDWVCLLLYTMEVYVMSNRVYGKVTTDMKKEEELSKLNKYTLYFEITKLSEMNNDGTEYMGMSFEDACTRYKDTHRNDHRKIFESYEEALEYSAIKRLDKCFIHCKSRKDYIYVLEKAVEYIHSLLDMEYDYVTTMLKWEWSAGHDLMAEKIMDKLNPKIRERIFTYNLAIDYLEMATTCLGIS